MLSLNLVADIASHHGYHHGHSVSAVLSGVCGSISIACWLIVFTPQMWENYKRKSTDGLSLAFVIIWLLGDFFNVIGAVLQKVLPTMIILAVYYTLADIVLLVQCLVYGTDNKSAIDVESQQERQALLEPQVSPKTIVEEKSAWKKNVSIVLLVILCGILGYVFNPAPEHPDDQPRDVSVSGQIMGWICALLYLASRLPQIKMNYERKSTDGIVLLFFVFAVLGNMFYVAAILLADASPHELLINASWLVGALGTLILDGIIFFQFWIYRNGASVAQN